jgi:hypothetical protein
VPTENLNPKRIDVYHFFFEFEGGKVRKLKEYDSYYARISSAGVVCASYAWVGFSIRLHRIERDPEEDLPQGPIEME